MNLNKGNNAIELYVMYVSLMLTDKECENLCMRGEDLMQRSKMQEKYGDLAGALIHCDQAIGNFNLLGL